MSENKNKKKFGTRCVCKRTACEFSSAREGNYFPADDVDVSVAERVRVVFPRNYAEALPGAIDGDCARSFDETGL